MSPLLFFPLYAEEKERKHDNLSKKEAAMKTGPLVDVEEA